MSSAVVLNSQDHSIADLPENIMRNIFQYMKVKDLLEASLVCQNFNKTIGTTSELMDKIRLHVYTNDIESTNEFLQNSSRYYEHIHVRTFSNYGDELEPNFECLKNHSKWRTARVHGHFGTHQATYTALFNALAENLEELNLNVSAQYADAPVHFPKLEVLECDKIPDGLECSTLKVLKCFHASGDNLMRTLKANKEIEDLALDSYYLASDSILAKNLKHHGIDLKLKKLWLKSGIHASYLNFLRSQSHNLEELTIDLKEGFQSFHLLFQELKVLRKLIIVSREFSIKTHETRYLMIDQNLSITELRFRLPPTENSNELFMKVISACPNITHLYVHQINQKQMEACSEKLKHLEFIYAFRTDFDSLPNENVKFKNLKQFKTFICSAESRLALNSPNFSEISQAIFKIVT